MHTSSGPNSDLRFPGQWFQSETGLHQNWMRDYGPTLGRYLQADPLGLVDGPAIYGYVLQNPGRYVDPRGEQGMTLFQPGDEITDIPGLPEMRDEFQNMRDANWIGADKYFHCKANCEASQCEGGEATAEIVSNFRELTDLIRKPLQSFPDSYYDQIANRAGRNGARNAPNASCSAICSQFRPVGLPANF